VDVDDVADCTVIDQAQIIDDVQRAVFMARRRTVFRPGSTRHVAFTA